MATPSGAEQFVIYLVRTERILNRFRCKGHVLQKCGTEGRGQLVQFRCVLFSEQQSVAFKALVISDYYIARFKFFDKIRV